MPIVVRYQPRAEVLAGAATAVGYGRRRERDIAREEQLRLNYERLKVQERMQIRGLEYGVEAQRARAEAMEERERVGIEAGVDAAALAEQRAVERREAGFQQAEDIVEQARNTDIAKVIEARQHEANQLKAKLKAVDDAVARGEITEQQAAPVRLKIATGISRLPLEQPEGHAELAARYLPENANKDDYYWAGTGFKPTPEAMSREKERAARMPKPLTENEATDNALAAQTARATFISQMLGKVKSETNMGQKTYWTPAEVRELADAIFGRPEGQPAPLLSAEGAAESFAATLAAKTAYSMAEIQDLMLAAQRPDDIGVRAREALARLAR